MDFSMVVTTLMVLVGSILFDWWYFLKLRGKRLPPGPSPWPIVGAIPQLVMHGGGATKLAQSLQSKYGKILTVWLGKTPMIFVCDSELAYDALVKQGSYFSNRVKNSSAASLSSGFRILTTSEGAWTVALRKNIITYMLGSSRVRAFKPLRDRAYEDIVNDVKSVAAAAEDGVAQVNLKSVAYDRVFRFMLVLTFGVEPEENLIQEIRLALGERSRLGFKLNLGDYLSFWRIFEVKHRQDLKHLQTRFIELYSPLIERLRRFQGDESVIGGNYIETLFQLEKDFPDFINESVITSLCSEFLSIANHATSLAMDTTLALLCEHPEAKEKLYREIEAVVGRRAVDESDVPKLPYLSAVVKESLRVGNPGLSTLPHATSELRELGGYDIPTDAVIIFVLGSFHLDPTHWSEPSIFKPERFLENDLDLLGTKNFSFLPFGAGRRVCPASQLVVLEMSVVVARLVQTFQWEKVPNVKNTGIGNIEFQLLRLCPEVPDISPRDEVNVPLYEPEFLGESSNNYQQYVNLVD
ncbi:hypothetical protein R1sor_006060 [Riccia sorocarpa]|uniref:Cytochrome P450 n=1 Tax=Riccia sorocarpa TaxID=122646 RepID=A0ABD3HPP4_9MARC